jgi:hypothetical protein
MKRVKSEPQNIEQEISNDEVWNRFAQSSPMNRNDRIPYLQPVNQSTNQLIDYILWYRILYQIHKASHQGSKNGAAHEIGSAQRADPYGS